MGREEERRQPYLGQLQALFIYLKTAKPVFEGEGERVSRQARTAGRSEGGRCCSGMAAGQAGRSARLTQLAALRLSNAALSGLLSFIKIQPVAGRGRGKCQTQPASSTAP